MVTKKTILFKVGEKVVYPSHGVGEVVSVNRRNIGGSEQEFYEISIGEKRFMVATVQADAVGLRRVVTRKAVDEVYKILSDRNFKADTQTWNRRQREYIQKIKTGSVFEIAKVIRDLRVLSAGKELSFGEKKMLDTAQGLLVSEIAVAKARSHDKVLGEIGSLFVA